MEAEAARQDNRADVPDVAVDAGGEGPCGRRHRRQARPGALSVPQAEAGVAVQERAHEVRRGQGRVYFGLELMLVRGLILCKFGLM